MSTTDPAPSRPRARRWAAPSALAAGLVAAGVAVPQIATAQGSPSLPQLSPQALVQRALRARPSHLSGTVQVQANLGLPDLSAYLPGGSMSMGSANSANSAGPAGSSGSATASGLVSQLVAMLSGTHTFQVWYGGPDQMRVSLPSGSQETDVIRNGGTLWLWQSAKEQATKIPLPAGHKRIGQKFAEGAQSRAKRAKRAKEAIPEAARLTPAQVADSMLAALRPTTRVFVTDTAWVAGRPAYELGLAPRSSQSLVADVLIAVDAHTGLPLRVQILARNTSTPALSVGFTQISYGAPAASNFRFTPPPGAKVTTPHMTRSVQVQPGAAAALPGTPGKVMRVKAHRLHVLGRAFHPKALRKKLLTGHIRAAAAGPAATIGRAWDTVVDLRSSSLTAGPELGTILNAARPVSGAWGQGRLVQTSLLDALILPNGHILVGAVTPAALEAAAAHLH